MSPAGCEPPAARRTPASGGASCRRCLAFRTAARPGQLATAPGSAAVLHHRMSRQAWHRARAGRCPVEPHVRFRRSGEARIRTLLTSARAHERHRSEGLPERFRHCGSGRRIRPRALRQRDMPSPAFRRCIAPGSAAREPRDHATCRAKPGPSAPDCERLQARAAATCAPVPASTAASRAAPAATAPAFHAGSPRCRIRTSSPLPPPASPPETQRGGPMARPDRLRLRLWRYSAAIRSIPGILPSPSTKNGRKPAGCSLIGKWPSSSITDSVAPGIAAAVRAASSGVQVKS